MPAIDELGTQSVDPGAVLEVKKAFPPDNGNSLVFQFSGVFIVWILSRAQVNDDITVPWGRIKQADVRQGGTLQDVDARGVHLGSQAVAPPAAMTQAEWPSPRFRPDMSSSLTGLWALQSWNMLSKDLSIQFVDFLR
jgi:hypothetical protein